MASWPTKPRGGSEIKQHTSSSLRIRGGRGRPWGSTKEGPTGELTQDILLIKQPGRPRRDTDAVKRRCAAPVKPANALAMSCFETADAGQNPPPLPSEIIK